MFASVVDGTYRKIFIIHSLARSPCLCQTPRTYTQSLTVSMRTCRLCRRYFSHTAVAAGAAARRCETDSCFTSSQVVHWIHSTYSIIRLLHLFFCWWLLVAATTRMTRSRVEIITLYFFNIWNNEIELNFTICVRSYGAHSTLQRRFKWGNDVNNETDCVCRCAGCCQHLYAISPNTMDSFVAWIVVQQFLQAAFGPMNVHFLAWTKKKKQYFSTD